jgi:hypothetical protein
MKRYKKKYRTWKTIGVDTFHPSRGGRPPRVDHDGITNIRQTLRTAVATQNCQTTMLSNFQIMLEGEVTNSKKRRGLAGLETRVSKKFVERFKENNNFVEATCQFKTHARIFAESDPRNLYFFAVMNEAFMGTRDASMCFNWDATQYCVDAEGHATIVKCRGDDDRPATALFAGGWYPWYLLLPMALWRRASFSLGRSLVLVTLSLSMPLGSWCSRRLVIAIYRWYAHNVVAPFVLKCREAYGNQNPDGTPMRAFVVCDGEPAQITVFQEDFILQLMAKSLIVTCLLQRHQ